MLGLLSILSLSLSLIWCGQWVLCHEKGTSRAININTLSNTPVYILPFLSLSLSLYFSSPYDDFVSLRQISLFKTSLFDFWSYNFSFSCLISVFTTSAALPAYFPVEKLRTNAEPTKPSKLLRPTKCQRSN